MSTIYQHFRPEEKDFIDQVINWKLYVENTYTPKLTDFLDPRQVHIVQAIIGVQTSVKLEFFGGNENCERNRMLLYPEYFSPANDDFQISLFEIKYPNKFVSINHQQVLGTLMSLGLKRDKFGDITIQQDRIQFFIAKEMVEYIKLELRQIGKTTVNLIEMSIDDAIETGEVWQEVQTTISSLRLDGVIAAIHNISRQKAQILIQHGHAKVNWRIAEQPSFLCEEGDIISARGYGRSKIISIDGKTKKEKWRIKAGVLK